MEPEACNQCGAMDCLQTATFQSAKAARIDSLKASLRELGREGKSWRERFVVQELLLNLGQRFEDADVISVGPKDEPPDVLFGAARFEVKEIFDKGRQRETEFKSALQEAEQATTCAELMPLEDYTPIDISLADVLREAERTGLKHSQRYDRVLVPTLDLLLYHNLIDAIGLTDEAMPSTTTLAAQRWRSVSVVFGHRAIVLSATRDAPAYLQSAIGWVAHRPIRPRSAFASTAVFGVAILALIVAAVAVAIAVAA